MNSDPWIDVLQQLEPQYFKWKALVEDGPRIFADLSQRGRWWCVILQEELILKSDLNVQWTKIGKLDERVLWTQEQLETWPDVKRMAHDMWYFKRKRDAEKFQTLYSLKWAE